jgi:hypothetical protein
LVKRTFLEYLPSVCISQLLLKWVVFFHFAEKETEVFRGLIDLVIATLLGTPSMSGTHALWLCPEASFE